MDKTIGVLLFGLLVFFGSLDAASASRLDEAMEALRSEDWSRAQSLARQDGKVALTIVEWHRLRAGEGRFNDYRAFVQHHGDWPGLPLLRRQGEDSIPPSADPREVIDYFLQVQPQTAEGAMRLAAALKALGESAAAEAEAVRAWTTMSLGESQESTLLAEYGRALADHHIARVDNLLWRHRFREAERMRPRVPEAWRKLMMRALPCDATSPASTHGLPLCPMR